MIFDVRLSLHVLVYVIFCKLPRLLEWLIDESVPQDLRLEAAVVLGSLAWGTEENIYHLVNAGAVPVLLRGINQFNDFIGIQYCIL